MLIGAVSVAPAKIVDDRIARLRHVRRDGELVLQTGHLWQCGGKSGLLWRDVPIVEEEA
jgi:hypothetical protein